MSIDASVIHLAEPTLAEQLESTPVGVELAALVFATDPALLDPYTQVAFVQACQRLLNVVTARQDHGVLAFVGANPRDTVYYVDGSAHALTDARALELQLALAWSEGHTRSRMQTARTLATQLPECAAVIGSGAVQPLVTRAIAEGAASLTASIDEAIAIAVRTKAAPAEITQLRDVRRDLLNTYDARLAVFAPQRSLKQVGRKVRDIIALLDPQGVLARRAKAIRNLTDVTVTNLADGMAMLTAILPTEQAHACLRVIDTAARDRRAHDPTDPIGLRRTNALFTLLTSGVVTSRVVASDGLTSDRVTSDRVTSGRLTSDGLSSGRLTSDLVGSGRRGVARRLEGREPARAREGEAPAPTAPSLRPGAEPHPAVPTQPGLPVHLDILMSLDALLGLVDESAVMPGAGAIPAHAARDLLADAAYVRIRRILTDPRTGHALDLGVRRYQLTDAEQQRIALRDRTCRMIDCDAPAHRCECDHAQPYSTGGQTRTANLGLACKRHHQHKTHAGWTITDTNEDGSCTWTSPHGRTYRHQAEPVIPASHPKADDPSF